VEIGSWKGKSTVWLGNGIRNNPEAKLFSIDPHYGDRKNGCDKEDTYSEFKKNIRKAKLVETVTLIRKTSEEAGKEFSEKIDLLFIDGGHSYEEANSDFTVWSKKLNPGAWVVFHDATILPGPWKAARDGIFFSPRYRSTGMLGSMVFGRFTNPQALNRQATNLLKNLITCLFTSIYARMRKIYFPRALRNIIRKFNFKRRVNQLQND